MQSFLLAFLPAFALAIPQWSNGVYYNGVFNNGVYNKGMYNNGVYNNGVHNGVDWRVYNKARLAEEDKAGVLAIPGSAGGLPVQVSPSMLASLAYFVNDASLDTCGRQRSKIWWTQWMMSVPFFTAILFC